MEITLSMDRVIFFFKNYFLSRLKKNKKKSPILVKIHQKFLKNHPKKFKKSLPGLAK
jgi:hypothetical protein